MGTKTDMGAGAWRLDQKQPTKPPKIQSTSYSSCILLSAEVFWLDNVYKLLQQEFENFLETSAIYWFNSVYITSNLFSIRQKTVTKWSLLIIIPCFTISIKLK